MRSPSFVKRKPASEAAAEIELDLTPMMSVFLILLPFLVSMAVLTHLTILEFNLPPNVGAGLAGGPSVKPKVKLTVVVTENYCAITRADKMLDSLGKTGGQYPLDSLAAALTRHRQEMNLDNELIVAPANKVLLKNVVAVMDRCRTAGFEKIGLGSAAENPGGSP
jgi:biopolymer transport protein ExbD